MRIPPAVYVANCITNAISANAGQDVIDEYVDEMIAELTR